MKNLLILVIVSICGQLALGAESSTPMILRWEEVVHRASEANEELRASRENLLASEYAHKGSYSAFMPDITASANYSQNGGDNTATTQSYSTALTLSQNLFSGLADLAQTERTSAAYRAATANAQATRAKISADLKSAYAGLYYAQNAISLSEDIAKRRESNLRLVELRFASGRENKGSVLLSKAYLEQAKLDYLQATQDLEVARAQMAKMLGLAEWDSLQVKDQVPLTEPPKNLDFKKMVMELPSYLMAVAEEEMADAQVTLSRSSFLPSLSVTARIGDSGDRWYPENNGWSIGAGISIPLFNGGKDYFGTRSSLASWRAKSLLKESALRSGVIELKQSYSSYLQSVQRLVTDDAFTEALAVRAMIAKQQYNNGLLNFNDWDIIENDLISRQKNRLLSEQNRVRAEAAWEQVLGRGVFNE